MSVVKFISYSKADALIIYIYVHTNIWRNISRTFLIRTTSRSHLCHWRTSICFQDGYWLFWFANNNASKVYNANANNANAKNVNANNTIANNASVKMLQ